jgi:hypothetical protein
MNPEIEPPASAMTLNPDIEPHTEPPALAEEPPADVVPLVEPEVQTPPSAPALAPPVPPAELLEEDVEMSPGAKAAWAENQAEIQLQLLRSVISNRTLSTFMITSELSQIDTLDLIQSDYMPLLVHVPHIDHGSRWIQQQLQACFGSGISFHLVPTGAPRRPDTSSAPHEVIFHVRCLSEHGLDCMEEGVVQFDTMPQSGVFTTPRSNRNWTEGSLVLTVADNLRGTPTRDELYDVCRTTLWETLKQAEGQLWIDPSGWPVKDNNPDRDLAGYSPYVTWLTWKRTELYNHSPWSEHSTQAVWELSGAAAETASYQGLRITPTEKKKPLLNSLTLRFPICLTDIIRAGLEAITFDTEPRVFVSDALFTQNTILALAARSLTADQQKRMYMARVVIKTITKGWGHPRDTIETLMAAGYNVGAVAHRQSNVNSDSEHLQITAARLVLGTDRRMGLSGLTAFVSSLGGVVTSWSPCDDLKLVRGRDYFIQGGLVSVRNTIAPRADITSRIMADLASSQEAAVSKGMASDISDAERLSQAVAALARESNRQEILRVEAQLQVLKKRAAEEGLEPANVTAEPPPSLERGHSTKGQYVHSMDLHRSGWHHGEALPPCQDREAGPFPA